MFGELVVRPIKNGLKKLYQSAWCSLCSVQITFYDLIAQRDRSNV